MLSYLSDSVSPEIHMADTASIMSDMKQMLDSAYKDIEENGMLPEKFENKDIPHFTLQVNVPCNPTETKSNSNKGYNHIKEHGRRHSILRLLRKIPLTSNSYQATPTASGLRISTLASLQSSPLCWEITPL
jgi:hypothetical protein